MWNRVSVGGGGGVSEVGRHVYETKWTPCEIMVIPGDASKPITVINFVWEAK